MPSMSDAPPAPDRWCRQARLKDGTPVLIRPVRHDDRERIVRAFTELEPETIYTRFFSYKKELTEQDLARIDAADFVHAVALVATIARDGDEVIIGGGAYTVVDRPGAPPTAEVSFTIEEDYQGQGLATMFMAMLTEIAREHGIARFEAEVLAGNQAMLGVFMKSGLPLRRHTEDGVVFVVMDLERGAAPPAPPA